jgi:hypothetical protein
MIVVACLACGFAIRVMPTKVADPHSVQEVHQMVGKYSDLWPNKFLCPRCNNPARGLLEREIDPKAMALLEVRDLTAHEALAAFNGLGLPEEQKCSFDAVSKLLLEQPVRNIIGTDVVGQARTIIDSLELMDGTRVYFGAGAEGACIYRITRPISYAERLLQGGESA